jgi:hypothetical protein
VSDHGFVAKARTGIQSIPDVVFEGIVCADHGSDAPLGPVSSRIGGTLLRDDPDPPDLCHPKGIKKTGYSTSNDEKVELVEFLGPLSHRFVP